MLGDAQAAFDQAGVAYPYAMVSCGAVMLFLLWIEHLANHAAALPESNSRIVSSTAVLMLSVHSLLMGAAFGIASSVALTSSFYCRVGHKGSAVLLAWNLGVQPRTSAWRLFLVFVVIFPLGALLGKAQQCLSSSLVETHQFDGCWNLLFWHLAWIAASPMIERCCNRRICGASRLRCDGGCDLDLRFRRIRSGRSLGSSFEEINAVAARVIERVVGTSSDANHAAFGHWLLLFVFTA